MIRLRHSQKWYIRGKTIVSLGSKRLLLSSRHRDLRHGSSGMLHVMLSLSWFPSLCFQLKMLSIHLLKECPLAKILECDELFSMLHDTLWLIVAQRQTEQTIVLWQSRQSVPVCVAMRSQLRHCIDSHVSSAWNKWQECEKHEMGKLNLSVSLFRERDTLHIPRMRWSATVCVCIGARQSAMNHKTQSKVLAFTKQFAVLANNIKKSRAQKIQTIQINCFHDQLTVESIFVFRTFSTHSVAFYALLLLLFMGWCVAGILCPKKNEQKKECILVVQRRERRTSH